jgi:hypothetical protein
LIHLLAESAIIEIAVGVAMAVASSVVIGAGTLWVSNAVFSEKLDRIRYDFETFKMDAERKAEQFRIETANAFGRFEGDLSDIRSKLDRLLGWLEANKEKGG